MDREKTGGFQTISCATDLEKDGLRLDVLTISAIL